VLGGFRLPWLPGFLAGLLPAARLLAGLLAGTITLLAGAIALLTTLILVLGIVHLRVSMGTIAHELNRFPASFVPVRPAQLTAPPQPGLGTRSRRTGRKS
jgi:hypothetical protein